MIAKGKVKIDYADIIKSRVSMPEIVARYTSQQIVRNRIRCPIHNGSDYNMRIYRNTYHCFVCHATGDVIQFVRSITGDSFPEALQRINRDFALGLPMDGRSDLDKAVSEKLQREIAERRIKEMLDDADRAIAGTHAANMAGLLHCTDLIIKRYRPYDRWSRWRSDWCEALRIRTEIAENLQ